MLLGAISIAAAACSSNAPIQRELPAITALPQPAQQDSSGTQTLFLSMVSTPPGQVGEFELSGKLLRRIRDGVKYPYRLFTDGQGTLYIWNGDFQPTVTEYASGSTKLLRTVKRGISPNLRGVGVDATGNLWVLNGGGPLVRYKADKTTLDFSTYHGLCAGGVFGGPAALAVDTFGTAYVGVTCAESYSGPQQVYIREYDGTSKVARTIKLPSNEQPGVLSTDENGTLYLQFFDSTKNGALSIAEYDRGKVTPSTTFQVTPTVQNNAGFTSFDSRRLYISLGLCTSSGHGASCTSFVSVYKKRSSKQLREITSSSLLFAGTAVDDIGNIYVTAFPMKPSAPSRLLVYSPTGDKPVTFRKGYRLGDQPIIYPAP